MKLPLSPGSGERQPNVPEISELPSSLGSIWGED